MDDETKLLCPIPQRMPLGDVFTYLIRQWMEAAHTAGHTPAVCRINPETIRGLEIVPDSNVKPGHILIEGK